MTAPTDLNRILAGLLWPLEPERTVDFTAPDGQAALRSALVDWGLLPGVEAQLGQSFDVAAASPGWTYALSVIADLLRFTEHQVHAAEWAALVSVNLTPLRGVTEAARTLRRALRFARMGAPDVFAPVMERGVPVTDEQGRAWMVFQTYADADLIAQAAADLSRRGLRVEVLPDAAFGPLVTLVRMRPSDGEHRLEFLLDAGRLGVVAQPPVDFPQGAQHVGVRHEPVHGFEMLQGLPEGFAGQGVLAQDAVRGSEHGGHFSLS